MQGVRECVIACVLMIGCMRVRNRKCHCATTHTERLIPTSGRKSYARHVAECSMDVETQQVLGTREREREAEQQPTTTTTNNKKQNGGRRKKEER
jgi:hypothetical protein